MILAALLLSSPAHADIVQPGSDDCGCATSAGPSMVFLIGLLPLLWTRRQR